MLTVDSLDDNKGVSSEGTSITSIPKEGPSIAKWSKEPILKELLECYGYGTVEDYLPVTKKPIPKVIFKSPIPIKGCVLGLANVETYDNIMKRFRMRTPERCADKSKGKRKNPLVEIQADDHDLLVNSDNENDDMLGYESEKYSDDEDADETNHAEDADGTNHSDLKLVKRGITRLYKFRREYDKPSGIKIKIGNKEIEADEEPPRGIMWLKGRVNYGGDFTDDEIRSVGDKLKEADDKIKERTLNLDDGTDAMTVMFGKEKVTPMGAYEVDRTQSIVVVRDKDARIQKKYNGLVTSKK
nr:hypothetical protein [Tanacetum cinerariifolium]